MGNVATKVKEVLREAQLSLDSTADRRMSGFTLPISFDFIQLQFGDAAKQVPSGQSVVIINPESQTAYKYCLASEDRREFYRSRNVLLYMFVHCLIV